MLISREEAAQVSYITDSLLEVPKTGVKWLVVLLKIHLEKKNPENKTVVVKEEDVSGMIID